MGLLSAIYFCLAFPYFLAVANPHPHGYVDGYIFAVSEEPYARSYELSLVSRPDSGPPLKELIFDSRLTNEFHDRYQQTFGYTDIERNIEAPNRYDEHEYFPGVWVTPAEDEDRRRQFGEYMVKRLAEHHIDGYFKSNPSVRPVYELKEKISNVKVEVKKGYKVRINYSYSGNYLNLAVENPYDVTNRVTLEMDPSTIGITEVNETRVELGYPIRRDIAVLAHYRVNQKDISLIGRKTLNANLSTTLTGTAGHLPEGHVAEGHHEERVLVGLTWTN